MNVLLWVFLIFFLRCDNKYSMVFSLSSSFNSNAFLIVLSSKSDPTISLIWAVSSTICLLESIFCFSSKSFDGEKANFEGFFKYLLAAIRVSKTRCYSDEKKARIYLYPERLQVPLRNPLLHQYQCLHIFLFLVFGQILHPIKNPD